MYADALLSGTLQPVEAKRVKPEPSYAPVYAVALYPDLARTFREHGYALAVHGSLQRDFDVIAIPWTEDPSPPDKVIAEIVQSYFIRQIGEPTEIRHGRIAYTISVGHGCCALDLSFMPTRPTDEIAELERRMDERFGKGGWKNTFTNSTDIIAAMRAALGEVVE